jgi:formylglycine-generating enzyme required for sulfatase activity
MKAKKLLLIVTGIILIFTACENPFFPEKKNNSPDDSQIDDPITGGKKYQIVLDIRNSVTGDTLTAAPDTAEAGKTITLSYTVANTAFYNQIDFGGVSAGIASVESTGSGKRTYTVNAADVINEEIKIIAVFTHTDLVIDHIEFEDTEAYITVAYGIGTFTNAITNAHNGTGVITYSSSDETVAEVDGAGEVTILQAGITEITAKKAADAVYAYAEKSYTLTVAQAPGAAVTTPTVYIAPTFKNITVNAVSLQTATGQSVEYAISTASNGTGLSAWQSSVTFTGLNLGTNYYVYARSVSNTNYETGISNVSAVITTYPMVNIMPGTFLMGSPTNEAGRDSWETRHTITFNGSFWMSRYQVTQELYEAVMGSNPSYFTTAKGRPPASGETDAKRPVDNVSWYDAIVFCNKLSIAEGFTPVYSIKGSTDPEAWGPVPTSFDATWHPTVDNYIHGSLSGYRLPTEARWEYACRAETTTAYNTGSSISNNTGWYTNNSGGVGTHQVGLKPANAWGLYDMHGNVWEWVFDTNADYSVTTGDDPYSNHSGMTKRVMRGGSYRSSSTEVRSAYRNVYIGPETPNMEFGFRLAR